jgi:hypothetical protein
VTSRSGRGRWQRVVQAREQARTSLGHDPVGGDPYGAPKRKAAPVPPSLPNWNAERPADRRDESVRLLSLR